MKDSARKAMFAKYKKGDYVHYKGWGLGKIVGVKESKDWNGSEFPIFRVSTKTFPKQHFQFGVKDAYLHELGDVIPKEHAMKMIEERKYLQRELRHLER
jgi:hypothetical protein